jgi:hypothetical protein
MDHIVSLASLALLDVGVRRFVTPPLPKLSHTRWCAVHAGANALVAVTATPSLFLHAPSAVTTRFPVTLALWLHAYHAVFYPLSADDRVHHLVYAAILGAPSYVYATAGTNAMLFFLTGVPGMLIYALVALRRCGRCVSWNEPVLSAYVNLGLRAPGICWCAWRYARAPPAWVPAWAVVMQVGLPMLNAVYYSQQSVRRAWRR